MRTVILSGLLIGLALPAAAADPSPRECAGQLFSDVQAERFRLEGETTRDARVARRFMKRGEKALGKIVARDAVDPSIDHKKLALFAKAGQWIQRARDTGAVADTSPSVTGWDACYDVWMETVDDFVVATVAERDRLMTERLRNKVDRRLGKGLALYGAAAGQSASIERARMMAKAMAQIEVAFRKAHGFCGKESKPRCPSGVFADGRLLTYRGRRSLTIFDVEWHITMRTPEGAVISQRDGHLADPSRTLATPLPWLMQRGDSLDALSLAGIPLGFGHRMDGVVTWTTSAGEIEVPIHIDQ